jgi:hypothetical protein
MSKTLYLVLGLALVWLTAWEIAGYFMGQAGVEKLAQADYLSTPATHLERGADVRVEGTIVGGPSTMAPFSQEPCLAAVTDIHATSTYTDSQNKTRRDYQHVATRRAGPSSIEIAVGDHRLLLPLERWSPQHHQSQVLGELPARLDVAPEEIARARERLQGSAGGFSISETTIDGGTHVFVVGQLEDREGELRLAADRVLGKVVLYSGSQVEFVNELRGSGGGLRIAGWILAGGVGPLPSVIIGLVLLVRYRRRSSRSAAMAQRSLT